MKCICGSEHTKRLQIRNGVPLVQCTECGIILQADLSFKDEKECVDFYRNKYQVGSLHTFEHDKEVSKQRLLKYNLKKGCKLLDVGAGNGAFVEVCREQGIEAFGCELGETNSEFIYSEELQDINFPTDYFDIITCHDVLEHLINPVSFLQEIFRVLKQEGLFILDFPNFFVEEGKHHWRLTEHIWYLTVSQLKTLVYSIGFELREVDTPIPSKKVLYLIKPKQERIKIAVPPGIGDVYWVMVKMQSFLKDRGLKGIPDIYILANKNDSLRRERAFDYIDSIPFVHSTRQIVEQTGDRKIWKKAYLKKSDFIFKNVFDCDYFIAYNGQMRFGTVLENLPGDCNWFPKMFYSLEQRKQEEKYRKNYGKFILLYFVSGGMYKRWLEEFDEKSISKILFEFAKETNTKLILTGANWDLEDPIRKELLGDCVIDLVGKTTFNQLISLIKASQGVVGFPSGLTILSTMLKKNTYMLWNDYFHEGFFTGACSSESYNNWYFFDNTRNLQESRFKQKLIEIFEKPELKILCVLKTGGDFSVGDVIDLKEQIDRHITIPYKFLCLTDVLTRLPKDIIKVELRYNLPGWWSKIELFRHDILNEGEKALYFDLDTAIIGDITDLTDLAMENNSFMTLRAFNKNRLRKGDAPASSIMVFPANDIQTKKVFEAFMQAPKENIEKQKTKSKNGAGEQSDQGFIGDLLGWNAIRKIQDSLPKYYIKGKVEVKMEINKPKNTSIIVWSGTPRLKKVKNQMKWLR